MKNIIQLNDNFRRRFKTDEISRKGKNMEEFDDAEILREETEQKMIYKTLLMLKESKSLEELEGKLKALLV